MKLTQFAGKYDKEFIRARALDILSDQWIVRDEGDDLFLERKGIDTILLMHRARSLRQRSIPFVRGVRLRFLPDRVEAFLSLNHSFYIFVGLAVVTMVLLAKGKKNLRDIGLIAVGGAVFYFVVTDRVHKELNRIF
ncbi:MAG: hypothetical protein V4598_08685 [Bdellovibrionota bacterium]